MTRRLALLSIGAWIAACTAGAAGPPEIVVDRSACSHCGMLISEVRYAAAAHVPGAAPRVFDDIQCLVTAMHGADAAGARFWFHDAEDGRWLAAGAAVFVASPSIRTPMGGGIVAYDSAAKATAAAAAHRGEVVASLSDLFARSKDAS